MLRKTRSAGLLAALLLSIPAASCAPPSYHPAGVPSAAAVETLPYDRLYFGRSIRGGGTVSEADWARFLDDVVTPLFPAGLTAWQAQGQWRDERGLVVRESTFVLELIHPTPLRADSAVLAIIDGYKQRFRQQSVMRVQGRVRVTF